MQSCLLPEWCSETLLAPDPLFYLLYCYHEYPQLHRLIVTFHQNSKMASTMENKMDSSVSRVALWEKQLGATRVACLDQEGGSIEHWCAAASQCHLLIHENTQDDWSRIINGCALPGDMPCSYLSWFKAGDAVLAVHETWTNRMCVLSLPKADFIPRVVQPTIYNNDPDNGGICKYIHIIFMVGISVNIYMHCEKLYVLKVNTKGVIVKDQAHS